MHLQDGCAGKADSPNYKKVNYNKCVYASLQNDLFFCLLSSDRVSMEEIFKRNWKRHLVKEIHGQHRVFLYGRIKRQAKCSADVK